MGFKQRLRGQIFVSYRHIDRDHVVSIIKELQHRNFNIWYDDRLDEDFGDEWQKLLDQAISDSTAVIACISPEYGESEICKWELKQAQKQNIHIFPVVIKKGQYQFHDLLKGLHLEGKHGVDLDTPNHLENLNRLTSQLPRPLSHKLPYIATLIVLIVLAVGIGLFVMNQQAENRPLVAINPEEIILDRNANPPYIHELIQADDGTIWIAAQFAEDDHRIYSLDPENPSETLEQRWSHSGTDIRLNTLHMDCHNTLWVGQEVFALDNEAIGLLGFDASQPQLENPIILNPAQIEDWQLRYSIRSITSRCGDDGFVTLWASDEGTGIQEFSYDTRTDVAIEPDLFFANEQVTIIEYMQQSNDLWVGHQANPKVTTHSASSNRSNNLELPSPYDGAPLLTFTSDTEDHVWTAQEGDLLDLTQTQFDRPISVEELQEKLATSLVIVEDVIWYGSSCEASDTTDCFNLFKVSRLNPTGVEPVTDRLGEVNNERIIDLQWIPNTNTMWIGTNGGLYISSPANQ